MEVWEIVFVVLVLKIPLAYVGYIVWWAIKAEPELGVEGGTEGITLRPWRRGPSFGGASRSTRNSTPRPGSRVERRSRRTSRAA